MTQSIISDSAERLFARCAADPAAGATLWAAVEEAGFPLALLGEERGGFGLTAAEALDILRVAARLGLCLPLAETMAANLLLSLAGADPVAGRATIALDREAAVPWGSAVDTLLVCEADSLLVVAADACRWDKGATIGGEPLDHVTALPDKARRLAAPIPRQQVQAILACLRSSQIAGALEGALNLTLGYAAERVQFGRSLSKFQVIQQYLAIMATQTAAAGAAARMAADALEVAETEPDRFVALAAAAKIRAGEAAGIVAELAHQVHGAIGFSQEYPLHPLTRQLWSWRDLDGSEAEWAEWLGGQLISSSEGGLWATITDLQGGRF